MATAARRHGCPGDRSRARRRLRLGRDAVCLAKRGWRVTAVDSVDRALASAQRRAAEAGVEVQWVKGDVAALDWLGLEPGYNLLYDFGCIHGLSDTARRGAAGGLTHFAAPAATLLMVAFKAGRGIVLPAGWTSRTSSRCYAMAGTSRKAGQS